MHYIELMYTHNHSLIDKDNIPCIQKQECGPSVLILKTYS